MDDENPKRRNWSQIGSAVSAATDETVLGTAGRKADGQAITPFDAGHSALLSGPKKLGFTDRLAADLFALGDANLKQRR